LTKVEAARVQKSKERLKIAQLERARDEKAAKVAGVPLNVPSREEAAELAAWHVVQQTKGIETAPRLARLEDLLTSWPLVHGLYPPAPIGNAQTDSRFIIASGVPGSAVAAEMQEACAVAFRSAIVSCEPWPSAPSSWCIGFWSALRASRALKTSLVVHGQPITLSACPCQDVPNRFELSGLVSLTAPEGQGEAQAAGESGDMQYCHNCGEAMMDPTEGICHACGFEGGDMEECPNCGEPEWDPSEQICHSCEYSREDY
jgi:ribosomal protein L37E